MSEPSVSTPGSQQAAARLRRARRVLVLTGAGISAEIEVNPEPTNLTPVTDVLLRGAAASLVPALVEGAA